MTNLEALSASVNYPVDTIKLQKILIDNKLSDAGDYLGITKEFELATAALYVLLVSSATISEGDFSISAKDTTSFIKLATGIFSKYNLPNPLQNNVIRNKSYYW